MLIIYKGKNVNTGDFCVFTGGRKEKLPAAVLEPAGRLLQLPPRLRRQDDPGAQGETVRRFGDLPGPERDVAGVRGSRAGGQSPSRYTRTHDDENIKTSDCPAQVVVERDNLRILSNTCCHCVRVLQ